MNLALSSIEQGLIYAILALGVYISYKILHIPDLTVDGAFPFGAILTAALILSGVNPILATIFSFLFGLIPGFITAILAIKLKINSLLSGILTMTMLYSINLRLTGRPNVPFTKSETIFTNLSINNSFGEKILILFIIVLILKLALDLFLKTEMGYMLIATGDNETLVKSLGKNPDAYKVLGLMLANGLVALSGSLFAQSMKFADIQMGIGTIVVALASIIIGDTLFRKKNITGTLRVIIGTIAYKIIGAIAIEAGLNPNDLKLINALIVIIFIAYNNSHSNIWKRIGGKDVKDKKA
ncbi:MAG: ABC transporter permease [Tissierellia bacterium]|nr:ABC transporter permease [Tissierellia bacterium]